MPARSTLRWAVIFAVAALAWAVLRLHFGEEYRHAPFASLVALEAPRPFGHRVLVPLLVRGPVAAGLPVTWAFGVVEAVAAFFLLCLVRSVLRVRRAPGAAALVALATLPVMALAFVAPRTWPVFYPWDTPALIVVVGAVAAAHARRDGWLWILAGLGALNRESALLVPVLLLALRIGDDPDRRGLLARAVGLFGIVLAVRVAILVLLPDNPGPALHFTVKGRYRLLENLAWMGTPSHWPELLGWGGWLAVGWPWLGRRSGWPWRRLSLVAAGWAVTALLVANVYEPRAFGEAIVLLWLATAIGRGGDGEPRPPWLRGVDRVGPWLLAVALGALALLLTRWNLFPVAQWPMP